jgi:hypothetical protein
MSSFIKTLVFVFFFFTCTTGYATVADTVSVKLVCTEKERKSENPGVTDPVIIKSCLLKDFKIVDTARPDYTGKYFHTYRVYKKISNHFVSAQNSILFKPTAIPELERIINRQVKKDYEEYIADKELKSCFPAGYKLRYYTIDDLSISVLSITDQKLYFEADFGISCINIGASYSSFSIKTLAAFLR